MAKKEKTKVVAAKIPKELKGKKLVQEQANVDYEELIPPSIENDELRMDEMNSIDIPDDFEPETMVVSMDDEGEIIVSEGPNALEEANEPDFYDNLVLNLAGDVLEELGTQINSYYDEDAESRSKRDEQQDDGLRQMGLDPSVTPSGANFEGASRVIHPVLSQAAVEFAGRMIKELCPPSGVVKANIIGAPSSKKIDEAHRKVGFMNTFISEIMPYRSVSQQTYSQLPIGGSQFMKIWHDEYLKRPTCEFLPIDSVFIPFHANDFYTASRVTVQMHISQVEYHRRIKSGLYFDDEYLSEIEPNSIMPAKRIGSGNLDKYHSESKQTRDKIEGKEDINQSDDGFTLLEVYTYLNLKQDDLTSGEYAPYIVTVKLENKQVISIYRNWDIKDTKKQKLDWIVKYDFIQWAGTYGLSICQLAGNLSVAATGALRALLDSAHVNNMPVALGLKGLKMVGQSPDINIGSITFFEGPNGLDDDIKKCFMPLPFNPPSPVLFSLLEWLTNAASQLVKTPDTVLQGMGDRTPANTTLAMIEQSSTTQSAIMTNLHFSQKKAFEIIGRLLRDHWDPAGYPDWLVEDYKANATLFEHTRDVIPVSDPNIFTEVQRYAQLEAVMKLAQSAQSGQFNMVEIYRRVLQLIKIPNPEMLLNVPQETTKSNAVAENMAIFLGQPVQVYADQDHVAHLEEHIRFSSNRLYGANQFFNSNMVPMSDHIKHHMIYYYAQTFRQQLKNEQGIEVDVREGKNFIYDKQLAAAGTAVYANIEQVLSPLLQTAQQVLTNLQQMQQQQSQQNMNPDQIKLQIEQTKLQSMQATAQGQQQVNQLKQNEVQGKLQIEQAKLQNDVQIEQMKDATENKRLAVDYDIAELQAKSDKEQNDADMQIEVLRLKKEHMESMTQLQIEHERAMVDLRQAALQKGHELGTDAAKHQHGLQHDMRKHEMSVEKDKAVAKGRPAKRSE